MFDQDPLELWLISISRQRKHPEPHDQEVLYQDLGALERWFAIPAEVRPKEIPHMRAGMFSSARLAEKDLLPVQQMYRQILTAKGNGKSYIEPALLALIAFTLDPSTIPFFVELLALPNKSGDAFANRRRELALGGLAFLAYQNDDPQAIDALIEATKHSLPLVRAQAIHCLKQVIVGTNSALIVGILTVPATMPEQTGPPALRREPSAALLSRLSEIVTSDPATQPRFMAREVLAELGQPAPIEHPDGAYAFKVVFKHVKNVSRTIELCSEQTLDDLHGAIQEAFGWDDDHLYCFYLNGKRDNNRYRFASPLEEDGPYWTTEGIIGELGLTLKHTFLYLFDYGDRHEFEIQVVGIRPHAEPGEYPRLIETIGKAPPQYYFEDEDEDEYEDFS